MILKDNFVTLIEKNNSNVINNKYTEYINNLPDNLENTSNFILYGPCGTGKYSEALKIIEKYIKTKSFSILFMKYRVLVQPGRDSADIESKSVGREAEWCIPIHI